MADLSDDAQELFEAVLEIEEEFGYANTNANTQRIAKIRKRIDDIVGKGDSSEIIEN